MYMGTGIRTIMVWQAAQQGDAGNISGTDSDNAQACGLAMGGLCIFTSLIFFMDYVMALVTKRRLNREAY